MFTKKFWMLLISAIVAGGIIGWVDSLPNWDDTGITVLMILVSTFLLGIGGPNRAWLWAIIVGGTVVGFNAVIHGNYQSILAVVVAFAGSYGGAFIKKSVMANPKRRAFQVTH